MSREAGRKKPYAMQLFLLLRLGGQRKRKKQSGRPKQSNFVLFVLLIQYPKSKIQNRIT